MGSSGSHPSSQHPTGSRTVQGSPPVFLGHWGPDGTTPPSMWALEKTAERSQPETPTRRERSSQSRGIFGPGDMWRSFYSLDWTFYVLCFNSPTPSVSSLQLYSRPDPITLLSPALSPSPLPFSSRLADPLLNKLPRPKTVMEFICHLLTSHCSFCRGVLPLP